MPSAQQSAWQVIALAIASGASSGSDLSFVVQGSAQVVGAFPGPQEQFMQLGLQLADLQAALIYAEAQGWLSLTSLGTPASPVYQLTSAGYALAGNAEQSAQRVVADFVAGGARPGRTIPFSISSSPLQNFPGTIQKQFLQSGQVSDLIFGLAYAVAQGWLSLGQTSVLGDSLYLSYVLEQPGFTEAGGSAPAQAASAQQLINVAASITTAPAAASFNLNSIAGSFVGTVGGNAFAPEDLIPAYGHALAQGCVRPANSNGFGNAFHLTATGAAQAA